MWFAALAAGLCLAIVVFTPGGPRRLWRAPLLSWWMLVLGVALQFLVAFVDFPSDRIDDLGFALLMVSYALLLAFCFVNIRLPGMWIVAAGLALNTVVVGLNQGMPTADQEQTTASGETVDRPIERTVKQRPESDDDILGVLGDVIELPEPLDSTISIGDIVIALGGAYFCFRMTRRPKKEAAVVAEAAAPATVPARAEPEFADFWAGEPGGEATGELPVVVDAPDADAQLAALEAAPLADIDQELKSEPDRAPATEREPEPAVISWRDERANGAGATTTDDGDATGVERTRLGAGDDWPLDDARAAGTAAVAEEDASPPIVFRDTPLPEEPAAPAAAATSAVDEHLFGEPAIAYDDELERKLAASENDPTVRERDRPPLIMPPATPPAAPAPPPAPAPTPPPAATPTAPPKPAPAPARPAAAHASSDQPPDADDPLGAELEKLFSKLSRGPGEGDS